MDDNQNNGEDELIRLLLKRQSVAAAAERDARAADDYSRGGKRCGPHDNQPHAR